MLQQLRSPRFLARLIAAGGGLALVSAPAVAMASTGHHQAPPRT